VKVGKCWRRASANSAVTFPYRTASYVSRRSRMKYSRVIVLPSMNSNAKRTTIPVSHGIARAPSPHKL
jgi:hypothetical protein